MMNTSSTSKVTVVGRYAIHRAIASGGMATVHFGRLMGAVGFARTVALKRLHPQFASDPEFVDMLVDEARIAGRIQHPNVVQTLDVVTAPGELLLVMEYVHGQSLSRLVKEVTDGNKKNGTSTTIPPAIVSAIVSGMLHGLHAAHEAKSDTGQPLGIVHRDVSPQNVVVGVDGVARVLDFGVAKAANRLQSTRSGQLKGKLAYMSPEQLRAQPTNRSIDIYAAGVVLWEALTLQRLFKADDEGSLIGLVLEGRIPAASSVAPHVPPALDEVIRRCVARDPSDRFQTAREAARALEAATRPALASEVGDWVEMVAKSTLDQRAAIVAELESMTGLDSQPGIAAREASPSPRATPNADDERTIRDASPSTREETSTHNATSMTAPLPQPYSRPNPSQATLSTPTSSSTPRWLIAAIAMVLLAGVTGLGLLGLTLLVKRRAPTTTLVDPPPPPAQATAAPGPAGAEADSSNPTGAPTIIAPSATASGSVGTSPATKPPRPRPNATTSSLPLPPSPPATSSPTPAPSSSADLYRKRW